MATCRGATRAARRREKHDRPWWKRANAQALPYRMAKVRAYIALQAKRLLTGGETP